MKREYYLYMYRVPLNGCSLLALTWMIKQEKHYCPPVIIRLPAYLKKGKTYLVFYCCRIGPNSVWCYTVNKISFCVCMHVNDFLFLHLKPTSSNVWVRNGGMAVSQSQSFNPSKHCSTSEVLLQMVWSSVEIQYRVKTTNNHWMQFQPILVHLRLN